MSSFRLHLACVLLVFACMATIGLYTASVASAEPPPSVSLSAEHTTVEVGESIHLTATASSNVGPTPYSIRIIESGTDDQVASCGSGTECFYSVSIGWEENEHPTNRSYRAEVSAGTEGERTISDEVTITVERDTFDISLSSTYSSVQVPESFTLTAKTGREVGPTPYSIRIIESGTGTQVASCGSGAECSTTIGTSWSENLEARARSFYAVVSSSSYTLEESNNISVAVMPFFFTVSLSLTYSRTEGSGSEAKTWYTATATTNRNVGPTPYWIRIKDGNTIVDSCGGGTECTKEVEGGPTYTAAVEDSEGHSFGSNTIDSLGGPGLAALFPSASEVCDAVLLFPYGTHLAGSEVNDQYLACETAVRSGATVLAVIAAVEATAHGEQAIWWLLHEGTIKQSGFELPAPSELDPYPVPPTLPAVWPVEEVAAGLIANNPTAELTEEEASDIAIRCLWDAALADLDGVSECETLPIFLSGSDVPSATEHDLKALSSYPGWVKLNYESGAAKEEKGEKRNWYESLGGCAGAPPTEQQCDEYPFFATQQGGPSKTPLANLEYVNGEENEAQGGKYGNFVSACKMAERGSTGYAFLAVPLPPSLKIPTTRLCNGNP
jgi:hypothetical protein